MNQTNGSATVIGLIVVAFIAVGAGGGYYYYTQNIAPKVVLANMASKLTNSNELKSFRYEGNLEGTYDVSFSNPDSDAQNSENTESQTFSASFDGLFDRTDSEQVEGKLALNWDGAQASQENLTVNTRIIGSVFYLSLEGSASSGSLPTDEWIQIDTTNTDELQNSGGALGLGSVDSLQNPNQIANFDFSQSEKDRLKQAFRKNQFIAITDTYGAEAIKGVKSHHYGYELQKDEYMAFLKEAQSILGKEQISDDAISSAEKSMQKIERFAGEVWVSKDRKLPTKLTADLKMNTERSTTQSLSFEITMSEHNTDFTVDEPESAKPLSEIFQGFFPDASQESFQQDTSSPSQGPEELPEGFENFDQESLQSGNTGSGLTEEQKQQLFEEYEQ